jgi:hypothetical protein
MCVWILIGSPGTTGWTHIFDFVIERFDVLDDRAHGPGCAVLQLVNISSWHGMVHIIVV